MKKLNLLWLALAATVLPGCSDNSEKGPGWVDPDVPRLNDMTLSRSEMEVRDGMNDFGFDLMHQISENYDNVYKNGNVRLCVAGQRGPGIGYGGKQHFGQRCIAHCPSTALRRHRRTKHAVEQAYTFAHL